MARESLYEVIDCILDGDQLNTFLLTISDHDRYTYTHSVNVGETPDDGPTLQMEDVPFPGAEYHQVQNKRLRSEIPL